jgi:mannose-6-phosphate isomerase
MNGSNAALLHFQERYYERIWGGTKLSSLYGKATPEGGPFGEAWLISDHPGDESVVDEGPLVGKTLHNLLEEDSAALLGSRAKLTIHGRFPLLLKILDSSAALSVQVHPDDETAKALGEPDVGKTEMWYVFQADPGSELICGIDPTANADQFAAAIQDGSVEGLMTRFEVEPGASTFVAAGIVHAIGGGIVLAEIQQNSDLTYRIYDWGRVQADGTARELHIEKACKAVQFGSPHGGAARPLSYKEDSAQRTVLSACRYFAAEEVVFEGFYEGLTRDESFHILLAKTDGVTLCAGGTERVMQNGEAVLVPASAGLYSAKGTGAFLDYYVPDLQRDIIAPLTEHGHAQADIVLLGGDPVTSDLRR